MDNQKHYILDTNVLLDDPEALLKLRNGNENKVYIPFHVLIELDKLKNNPRVSHLVAKVTDFLSEYKDQFTILETRSLSSSSLNSIDHQILMEIENCGIPKPTLITNDQILQLQAGAKGIQNEIYKNSVPFKSEAEHYTGFVQHSETPVINSFSWSERNTPIFHGAEGGKMIDYQHRIWNVVPRNIYQNLAFELMMNPDIQVMSMQSEAGYGKSYLALAAALHLVFEAKAFEKIYIVKPIIEIGKQMGFLPGKVLEKMEPYMRYVSDLILKLHRLRPANRIFTDADVYPPQFNSQRFELLPLAYIRGMNIEKAVVIIDEMQNLSRAQSRALLSRLGEGVKCICLGDIRQVDNPYLNMDNNGLNWIVKKFKGSRIYAHIVLKGEKSRGPITDLVIRSGL